MSSNVLRLGRTKTVRGVCQSKEGKEREEELVAAFQSQIKEFR